MSYLHAFLGVTAAAAAAAVLKGCAPDTEIVYVPVYVDRDAGPGDPADVNPPKDTFVKEDTRSLPDIVQGDTSKPDTNQPPEDIGKPDADNGERVCLDQQWLGAIDTNCDDEIDLRNQRDYFSIRSDANSEFPVTTNSQFPFGTFPFGCIENGNANFQLLLGSPFHFSEDREKPEGAAYLTRLQEGTLGEGGDIKFQGARGWACGSSVATVNDLDGDGHDELLIGCPGAFEFGAIFYVAGRANWNPTYNLAEIADSIRVGESFDGFSLFTLNERQPFADRPLDSLGKSIVPIINFDGYSKAGKQAQKFVIGLSPNLAAVINLTLPPLGRIDIREDILDGRDNSNPYVITSNRPIGKIVHGKTINPERNSRETPIVAFTDSTFDNNRGRVIFFEGLSRLNHLNEIPLDELGGTEPGEPLGVEGMIFEGAEEGDLLGASIDIESQEENTVISIASHTQVHRFPLHRMNELMRFKGNTFRFDPTTTVDILNQKLFDYLQVQTFTPTPPPSRETPVDMKISPNVGGIINVIGGTVLVEPKEARTEPKLAFFPLEPLGPEEDHQTILSPTDLGIRMGWDAYHGVLILTVPSDGEIVILRASTVPVAERYGLEF